MWKFFTGTQRDLKARPGKVTTARKQALESRQRWRKDAPTPLRLFRHFMALGVGKELVLLP
jgi:hypothetical protein